MTRIEQRIEEIITEAVEALGYHIVRVMVSGKQRPVLQVMVERQDGAAMTVDDCASVSRTTSTLLDVDDPLDGAYSLEVSSPGIDRPLTRPHDYDRFAGFEARLELESPVDGRRRFQGQLLGRDGDRIRIVVEGNEVRLPLADVRKAKLVLTDELIASGRN
ncbi:MAG: ribosome maturation factor RimP [Acetobacterales bacterium]